MNWLTKRANSEYKLVYYCCNAVSKQVHLGKQGITKHFASSKCNDNQE